MTHEPLTPIEIAVIPDRIEHLRACAVWLATQRRDEGLVMSMRDDAIRELRAEGMSRTRISARTGVSLPVVVDALRARK